MFKIKGVPILVVIHIIKFLVTAPRTPITIGTTNIIIIIIIFVAVVVIIMPNVSQSFPLLIIGLTYPMSNTLLRILAVPKRHTLCSSSSSLTMSSTSNHFLRLVDISKAQ